MNTVITQALATGLPVVATRHSGFPDQVEEGVNGYLVPEKDPTALAKKISEFLDHPERWHAMSEAARKHAELHYDSRVLVDLQIALYHRVVARSVSDAGGETRK